jgi:hypothetical protein
MDILIQGLQLANPGTYQPLQILGSQATASLDLTGLPPPLGDLLTRVLHLSA